MNRLIQTTFSLLAIFALTAKADAQDQPPTPAEQFQALRKEYNRPPDGGFPKTDEERLKYVGRSYKHHNEVARRFVELAEKYPRDPIALDALLQAVWQVNTMWPVEMVGADTARPRAFELMHRDHLGSDRLGPLCQRIAYGFAQEYEPFLRALAEKNPHKTVRGIATLSLGQHLCRRQQRIDLCREQADTAKEFAGLFGREYLDRLLRQDRRQVEREAEAILDTALAKFAEIKLDGDDTIGDRARSSLFEIRHLSVGKQAPDIEAEDQDGKRFKLSDYRGKAVLLDFWSYV